MFCVLFLSVFPILSSLSMIFITSSLFIHVFLNVLRTSFCSFLRSSFFGFDNTVKMIQGRLKHISSLSAFAVSCSWRIRCDVASWCSPPLRDVAQILLKKVYTKSGSTKIIFIDRCALIFREPLIWEKRTREHEIEKFQAIEHNTIILSLSSYYTHEKGSSSSRSSSLSTNLSFTEFMIFLRNSSFTLPGLFVVKWVFKVMNAFSNPVNNILSQWW